MSGYLIVGPSWIGDIVMAQSLIISLKQREPEAPVDIIAPAWSAPVARRMAEVREAIVLPVAHRELGWAARRALGRELRGRGYTQAIVLPRSLKSALVPWFARVPRRTGYRGEWRYGPLNDVRQARPLRSVTPARHWLALGYPSGADLPAATPQPRLLHDRDNQRRLVRALKLQTGTPVVALVPGAEHGWAKRWPAEYFGQLAGALAQRGIGVWILGGPREATLGESIAAQAGAAAVNLCGRTELPDVIDLLAMVDGVVCNDSGLMHVAAALGVFVVALYGPSTPAYTPPMTENCRVLYLDLACSPCFAKGCPLGHHRCLRRMTPEVVLDALLPGLPSSAAAMDAAAPDPTGGRNDAGAHASEGSASSSST
jgi:heptosyltransferase-2